MEVTIKIQLTIKFYAMGPRHKNESPIDFVHSLKPMYSFGKC